MDHVVYRSPPAAMTPCCPYRECGTPVLNTRRYAARTRPSNIGYSVDYHGPKNAGQKNNSKKEVPIDIGKNSGVIKKIFVIGCLILIKFCFYNLWSIYLCI